MKASAGNQAERAKPIESLVVTVELLCASESHEQRCLLDTGSQVNLISQRLVKQLGLTDGSQSFTTVTAANGDSMFIYGTHELDLRVTDSKGQARTQRETFLAADIAGEEIILGYGWVRKHQPVCAWTEGTWRYPIDEAAIEIVEPEDFYQSMTEGQRVHAVFCTGRQIVQVHSPSESRGNPRTYATQAQPILPEYLNEYADVFSAENASVLPAHGKLDHAIDLTPNSEPPYGPLYNLSQNELQVLREYLEESANKGWIRRSTSPAGAPVLFVPKKDGGLRLCVDYRGLNAITIKNRHALPLISETLDRLVGAVVYTKLDMKDAYHRIRIKAGDEWKTAFRTRYGHFEYLVMPFGLANAPATFQAYISQALVGLVDTICVVYLDDILIYSSDDASHERHVKTVLDRLRQYKLYCNLKKCEFKTSSVEFLGFVVGTAGVSMEPSRIETITQWEEPTTFKELQQFLGFANFYRRFVYGYSKVVKPLTDLLKGMQAGVKTGPFVFPAKAAQAFRELKVTFTTAPVLAHFDPAKSILMYTDASGFAIAAVLMQQDDAGPGATTAHWRPVAFFSRKMTDAETRYETHDGELLAIVAAFRNWRHYLEGSQRPIVVRTDHDGLKYFMTKRELNRRQARWAEKLASFDFTIEYIQGKINPADGPSRRPDYKPARGVEVESMLPTLQKKLQGVFMTRAFHYRASQATLQRRVFAAFATHEEIVSPDPTPMAGVEEQEAETPERRWLDVPPDGQDELSSGVYIGMRHSPGGETSNHSRGQGADRMASATATSEDNTGSDPRLLDAMQAPAASGVDAQQLGETTDSDGLTSTEESQGDEPAPTRRDAGCKQSIPRMLVMAARAGMSAYEMPTSSLLDLVLAAQRVDPFVQERKWEAPGWRGPVADWSFDRRGLLCKDGKAYVPDSTSLRDEIMRINHDDPHASHFGAGKTLELLRRHYFWENMTPQVKAYVKTCGVCQRTRVHRHRPYGELASLPQPKGPWQEISMDFITDLPPSAGEGTVFDSIFVVVDRYTKMSLYIPTTKTVTAEGLATVFLQRVVRTFGIPKGIVSDRGSVFTSKFWSSICFYLSVKRRLSTAFHPQTDGQTERQNQTLEHYLRCYCNYRQDDWYSKLPLAEFTYNNSVHSTIGITPFFALYGYNPEIRTNIEADAPGGEAPNARIRIEKLERERAELEKRWLKATAAQQKGYNQKHTPRTFNLGDMVMLSAKNLRQLRPSKKLADRHLGPFEVIGVVGTHRQAYKLRLPASYKIHPVFHVSLLEPYHRREGDGETPDVTPVEIQPEGDYWEVETILAHRDKSRRLGREYYVRWKGFSPAEDSWEPETNFKERGVIRDYERSAGDYTAPTKRNAGRPRKT